MNNFRNKVINADALSGLKSLPDKSIHSLITSPPYFALRDYQTGKWVGGKADCDHFSARNKTRFMRGKLSEKQFSNTGSDGDEKVWKEICPDCGAKRIDEQIGLETTPEEYVNNLCNIFDEAKRVLRDDGTCWVVIGDTYLGSGKGVWKGHRGKESWQFEKKPKEKLSGWRKAKQLALIPSRFAIEMQNRGWILRNKIIWNKPNCIPQSCTDRFTNCYEEVLFFVKSSKYYFEQQFEPFSPNTDTWYRRELREGKQYNVKKPYKGNTPYATAKAQNPSDTKRRILESMKTSQGRNKRNVWSINTKPFKGAHFAVFPKQLIEPMILAGCPKKICEKCGKPWKKIVKRTKGISKECPKTQASHEARGGVGKPSGTLGKSGSGRIDGTITIQDYQQQCNCNSKFVSGIVCDIFGGSGTSGLIAKELGRDYLLFDLNKEYCEIATNRIQEQLL